MGGLAGVLALLLLLAGVVAADNRQAVAGEVVACAIPARAHPSGMFSDDDVGAAGGALACANVVLVQMMSGSGSTDTFKVTAVRVTSFASTVFAPSVAMQEGHTLRTRALLRIGSIAWWAWIVQAAGPAEGGNCYGHRVAGEITTHDIHATGLWYSAHSIFGLCIGERRDWNQGGESVCSTTLRVGLRNSGFSEALYETLQPTCAHPYRTATNAPRELADDWQEEGPLREAEYDSRAECDPTQGHPVHLVVQLGFETLQFCFPAGGGPLESCVEIRVTAACVALAVIHTLLDADISLGIMMAAAGGALSVGPVWLRVRLGLSVLLYIATFLACRCTQAISHRRYHAVFLGLKQRQQRWRQQDEMVICGALFIIVCDYHCSGPVNELATAIAVVAAVWMSTHRRQKFLRVLQRNGEQLSAPEAAAAAISTVLQAAVNDSDGIVTPDMLLLAVLCTAESLLLPWLLVQTTVVPILRVIIAGVPFQSELAYLTVFTVVPFAAICAEQFHYQQQLHQQRRRLQQHI